jgi:ADP-heptose:LPS heptosyltransferase
MAATKQRILVIRFSALGDVVMTVPVVKTFLAAHPDTELVMLSDQRMADLFKGIDRLVFVGADLKGKHKGLLGIVRLYQMLKKEQVFEKVADLHGVIRSHLLRLLFKFNKKETAVIDKGRFEKFALVRKENKIYRPLKHSTERYLEVFSKLGFKGLSGKNTITNAILHVNHGADDNRSAKIKIGFAPFAKHVTKMYPLDRFLEVIRFYDKEGYELYFFGGGPVEKAFIKEWATQFKHTAFGHEILGLSDELQLMKTMHVVVTMDSANLHLASLAQVPVVSVWGPTHPHAGFYGLGQDPLNAVQVSLSCRPCSVFGNKKCWRGDHACMQEITTDMVIEKIQKLIS